MREREREKKESVPLLFAAPFLFSRPSVLPISHNGFITRGNSQPLQLPRSQFRSFFAAEPQCVADCARKCLTTPFFFPLADEVRSKRQEALQKRKEKLKGGELANEHGRML